MATSHKLSRTLLALAGVLLAGGCASSPPRTPPIAAGNARPGVQGGPVVLNPQSQPEHIELNRNLVSVDKEPHRITADILDVDAPIDVAQLQIANTGIFVPLSRVDGHKWGGGLSALQLRAMAIAGRSIAYEGRIIVRDKQGGIGITGEPIKIYIDAPPGKRS